MGGRKIPRGERLHGRYSRVYSRMWSDRGFRALTPLQPSGQALWLYLLSTPHRRSVPGVIVAGEAQLADELQWPADAIRSAIREALGDGGRKVLIEHDPGARLIVLINGLRYDPPASIGVVRSWRRHLDDVPESDLIPKHLVRLRNGLIEEQFGPAFLKAFDDVFPAVAADAIRHPIRNAMLPPASASASASSISLGAAGASPPASSSSEPKRVPPPPPPPPKGGNGLPPRSARRGGGGGGHKNGATATETLAPPDDEVHRAYARLREAHPALACWPKLPTDAFQDWWRDARGEGQERLEVAAKAYADDVLAGRFRVKQPVLKAFLGQEVWWARLPPHACFWCHREGPLAPEELSDGARVCFHCRERLPEGWAQMPRGELDEAVRAEEAAENARLVAILERKTTSLDAEYREQLAAAPWRVLNGGAQ